MDKIGILGDTESIKGYAAIGLDLFVCERDDAAHEAFKRALDSVCAVLFITEHYYSVLEKEIEKVDKNLYPSVVAIPGTFGDNGVGVQKLKSAVEKAVGSDIIFNK